MLLTWNSTGKFLFIVLLLQNMGRTCCVQKLFWMSETISVHNMFSPGLSLEFSCIETCNSMNNLSSYCGLVDAKIRASDKDLPVIAGKIGTCLFGTIFCWTPSESTFYAFSWIPGTLLQDIQRKIYSTFFTGFFFCWVLWPFFHVYSSKIVC